MGNLSRSTGLFWWCFQVFLFDHRRFFSRIECSDLTTRPQAMLFAPCRKNAPSPALSSTNAAIPGQPLSDAARTEGVQHPATTLVIGHLNATRRLFIHLSKAAFTTWDIRNTDKKC